MKVGTQKMKLLLIMLCLGISIVIIATISNNHKEERTGFNEAEIMAFFYDNRGTFEDVSIVLYDSEIFLELIKERGEPTIYSATMSEIKEYLGLETVDMLDFMFSAVSLEQIKRKANCIEYCFSVSDSEEKNVFLYYVPGDDMQVRKTIIYLEQYNEITEISEHWYRVQ